MSNPKTTRATLNTVQASLILSSMAIVENPTPGKVILFLSAASSLRRGLRLAPDHEGGQKMLDMAHALVAESRDHFLDAVHDRSFLEAARQTALRVSSGELSPKNPLAVTAVCRGHLWLEALDFLGAVGTEEVLATTDLLEWLRDMPEEARLLARKYAKSIEESGFRPDNPDVAAYVDALREL